MKIFVSAALTFFEENLHMPYHTMQPDTESEGTDEEQTPRRYFSRARQGRSEGREDRGCALLCAGRWLLVS